MSCLCWKGAVVAPGLGRTQQSFLAGFKARHRHSPAPSSPSALFSAPSACELSDAKSNVVRFDRSDRYLHAGPARHGCRIAVLERAAREPLHAGGARRHERERGGDPDRYACRPLWDLSLGRHTASDFWIALLAFALLTIWRLQPWIVVGATVTAYMIMKSL